MSRLFLIIFFILSISSIVFSSNDFLVWIKNNKFSPNNDGIEDKVKINLYFKQSRYCCH